jgi:hypothetical protein
LQPVCAAIRREPSCGAPRSGLPPASAAPVGGAIVTDLVELKPPAPGTLLEGGHDRCEHRAASFHYLTVAIQRCRTAARASVTELTHLLLACQQSRLSGHRGGRGLRCPPRAAGLACREPARLAGLSGARQQLPKARASERRQRRTLPPADPDSTSNLQFRGHVTQNYQIREQHPRAKPPPPIGRDARHRQAVRPRPVIIPSILGGPVSAVGPG